MTRRLTVYLRVGCSLCENMLLELEPLRRRFGFELSTVDIDADPALRERYHERVPVLCSEEGELCHWFLDPKPVERYFTGP